MDISFTNLFQTKQKNNKGLMILSFFGILFVIDAHLGSSIGFFSDVFPYDSFFMPMFVFISGYFYKESYSDTYKSVGNYILHKTKSLLLPYLFWVFVYGIFLTVMRAVGLIKFGGHPVSVTLMEIVTSGWSYGFNDPSWFVPLLFSLCAVYCLLRKILSKCWNDWLVAIFLIGFGIWAVFVSKTDFNIPSRYMLIKISFFLQFYHIGLLFRKHIEPRFDNVNTLFVCTGAAVVNIVLLVIYGEGICFPNCAVMGSFRTNNLLLPLLTSLTGITFWLKVSKALVPVLGNNPIVNYISSNTFFLMTHHLFFKWVFNGFLLVGKKLGISGLQNVDSSKFVSDPWYIFSEQPWTCAACFLFMIIFCVTACRILQRIKQLLFHR